MKLPRIECKRDKKAWSTLGQTGTELHGGREFHEPSVLCVKIYLSCSVKKSFFIILDPKLSGSGKCPGLHINIISSIHTYNWYDQEKMNRDIAWQVIFQPMLISGHRPIIPEFARWE